MPLLGSLLHYIYRVRYACLLSKSKLLMSQFILVFRENIISGLRGAEEHMYWRKRLQV